jgi:hypothetical protein
MPLSVSAYNIRDHVPYKKAMLLKRFAFLLACVLPAVAGPPLFADELPLFEDDQIIKAVLTAPIAQAYAQKNQDARIYLPGHFTYIDRNGETVKLDVSIRSRGNFRRIYCELAPLRLNFKKSQVVDTLFAGQDKLKLVAPCFDSPSYQRYVVLEYLAYRILEVLTDYSYRTRLIRLSYIDSDDKLQPRTAVTFVIEEDSDMAKRLGLEMMRVPQVRFAELDREKTALAELFQLLIGNNDYSVLKVREGEDCCHNVDILAFDEASLKIPIPFDFDFSGFVNAVYAAPPSHLPITEVRYRYYTGLCHPTGVLEGAIARVQEKREEIFALVENQRELSRKGKRDALRYIEYFYAILDNPKRLETEVYERCRGRHLLEAMTELSTDPA